MYQQRIGARAEHLQAERERISISASLAEKFADLKSLSVELAYFSSSGTTPLTQIKYTFNLAHAKSVLLFDCPNSECVGGNFDLSNELAHAVGCRHETLSGEVRCHGWQSKTTIDRVTCGQVLRYKLALGY